MPLFKKSPEMTSRSLLPDPQRRVLRRCRMLLIKDLDTAQILDLMMTEDGFRNDQCDAISAGSTREQRIGVLLDQLELRGESTFNLFLDVLQRRYKHLYVIIAEMLVSCDDDCSLERATMTGTAIRRLLRNSSSTTGLRENDVYRGSLSADESFDCLHDYRKDERDVYIGCFTVTAHGRLQHESWIHHNGMVSSDKVLPTTTYSAQLLSDITFKRIDGSVPSGVQLAPSKCVVYVVTQEIADATVQEVNCVVPVIHKRSGVRQCKVESKNKPPPVPAKPLMSRTWHDQGQSEVTSPFSSIRPPVPSGKPHVNCSSSNRVANLNESLLLNYNISACSTANWIYADQKRSANITMEENHYEPVTPVCDTVTHMHDNIFPVVDILTPVDDTISPADSEPVYSIVDKERKTKRCNSHVSAKAGDLNKSDTGSMSGMTEKGERSFNRSLVNADIQNNDIADRVGGLSEADKNYGGEPLRKSSSYGDLPCNEMSVSGALIRKESYRDPQSAISTCDDDESSIGHSYYEDIDTRRSHSALSFGDLHSTDRKEADGVLRMCRGSLLIAECREACPLSPITDSLLPFIDTVLSFDSSGNAFYVPRSQLSQYGNPEAEAWFYPLPLTPRQATIFLAEEKLEGCFIVYRPTTAENGIVYNLSVCRDTGDVLHYQIGENFHGDYSIVGHDHSFITISELVSYFQHNKSSLATRLGRPLAHARLPVTPGLHYDVKFELKRSDLALTGRIIGKGNFGVICAGVYRNRAVAIKVLHRAELTASDEDDFIEEAKSLMSLKHDQVLEFIGIVGASKPLFIVTEFATRGSLKDCLRNETLPKDCLETLFDVCIQVVSAMQYLESRHYMLHRDLAARNFLVTQEFRVKLADFGRARFVLDNCYQAARNEKICIKWSPPEVLLDSFYSTKSDVWAMGVVFWEIMSHGERPYNCLSGEQTAVYVVEGGRLDKPPGCPPDLFNIMRTCWSNKAADRPSFSHLSDKLRSKSSIYYVRPKTHGNGPKTHWNGVHLSTPSGKPKTPNSKSVVSSQRKMRKSATANGDFTRFEVEFEALDEMDRRIPVTSSSETSLASVPEDIGRGDKIRQSIRKLMNIKTNGKQRKSESVVPRTNDLNDIKSAGISYS